MTKKTGKSSVVKVFGNLIKTIVPIFGLIFLFYGLLLLKEGLLISIDGNETYGEIVAFRVERSCGARCTWMDRLRIKFKTNEYKEIQFEDSTASENSRRVGQRIKVYYSKKFPTIATVTNVKTDVLMGILGVVLGGVMTYLSFGNLKLFLKKKFKI